MITKSLVGGLTLILVSQAMAGEKEAFKALRPNTLKFDVGSGSLVVAPSGNTYMLTNFHVCNASVQDGLMEGALPDGTTFLGEISKQDIGYDLCAIKVKSTTGLKIGNSFPFQGELYTRGYPHMVLSETSGKYYGIIDDDIVYSLEDLSECPPKSTKFRDHRGRFAGCTVNQVHYSTTLHVRPGASGSPVVDANGTLVGVVATYSSQGPAHAGIVFLKQIKDFFKDL